MRQCSYFAVFDIAKLQRTLRRGNDDYKERVALFKVFGETGRRNAGKLPEKPGEIRLVFVAERVGYLFCRHCGVDKQPFCLNDDS